jgi:hypothetical protein
MTTARLPVDRTAVHKVNVVLATPPSCGVRSRYPPVIQIRQATEWLFLVAYRSYLESQRRGHTVRKLSTAHIHQPKVLRRMTRFMPLDVQIRGSNTSLTFGSSLSSELHNPTLGCSKLTPSPRNLPHTSSEGYRPRACTIPAPLYMKKW